MTKQVVQQSMGKTTIQLEEKTRDKLRTFGKKGESYDDIVMRLMKFYEENAKE